MTKFMLGRKAGMTQLFDDNGNAIPVTVVECGPITVLQRKTQEIDGYSAVKVGFSEKREKSVNKPDQGQFKKAGVTPKKYIKEFHVGADESFDVAKQITASEMFEIGDHVDVTGVSKGKGFQGAIKRHNQSRGPMSHGSRYHRRVGSMGPSAYPARVMKGKKLPGHMGAEQVTVMNLDVVLVDGERNIIAIKGALPGPKGGFVSLRTSVKAK